MFSLFAPLLAIAATVVLHLALWRSIRPRSPARLLLPAAVVGALLGAWAAAALLRAPSTVAWVEAGLLFGAILASYLISLPALEAESPSSLIVMHVDERAGAGSTDDDLAGIVNDETFVLNRIQGLEVEGLVDRREGRLRITPSGQTFLDGFLLYHRLAGRRALAG